MLTYENARENGYTIDIAFKDRWGICFGLYNPQKKMVIWENSTTCEMWECIAEQDRKFYLELQATQATDETDETDETDATDATDATDENEHLIRIACSGFIGLYNPSTKTALFEDGDEEYIGSMNTRFFKVIRAAYIEIEEDCWAEFDQRMKPVTE